MNRFRELLIKNYFILFTIFAAIPIFFTPNTWDSAILLYAFDIENLNGVESWFKEAGIYFQFFVIQILFLIKKTLHINHEFLFDVFTIGSLILFTYEVKKYSEQFFSLDNKWSNFCAILVITFPVWPSLNSVNLALYVFCFYLALVGHRLFFSKNFFVKLIALLLILFSFSIKSNLAFVIGLSFIHVLKNYFEKKILILNNFLILITLSSAAYIVDINYFPPSGFYSGYNQIKINEIDIFLIAKSFYNFCTFFIFYLWIPIIFLFLIKLKNINFQIKNVFIDSNYILIFLIFCASVAPYCLLGRYTDLFYFSEYTGRHAYLVSISFGLFFAILFKNIAKNYFNKKYMYIFMSILVIQNLLILSIGQYSKIESAIFKQDFVKKIKKLNIQEGKVLIINKSIIIDSHEINYLFYKAYGKAAWNGEFTKNEKKKDIKIEKKILNNQKYKTYRIIDDYKNDCISILKTKNELSRADRFKKLYILNYKKYYLLELLESNC